MGSVRAANVEDIGAISKVLAASWKTAYRGIVADDYLDLLTPEHWVDFLRGKIKSNDIFAMVLEEQGIIGAAILKAGRENEANLVSFYLLPGKTGQGLGHAFYEAIEAELKARGFSKCVLSVLENNKRAIRFYEAHGFTGTNAKEKIHLGNGAYLCNGYEKCIT